MFDPLSRHVHASLAQTAELVGRDVTLARVPDLSVLVIRTSAPVKDWPAGVGDVKDVSGASLWCTRPNGWLAVLPADELATKRAAIEERLAPTTYQCLDAMGGFLTVDVSGASAASFLDRGIAIGLAGLSERRGARTLCAGLPVFVRGRAGDGFRFHIDISLADPFWRWATEAIL